MTRWPLWARWALGSVTVFLLAVGLWVWWAPLPLGGDMAYIVLTGNSMSPRFRKGDLVITRRASIYRVGDIVAYRHPQVGYVFHRIVEVDAEGRFVLQGDHNAWRDAYHPKPDEVVGRLVGHIRGGGTVLLWLRQPWVLASLTALLVWVFVLRQGPHGERKATSRGTGSMMRMDRWMAWLMGSAGALLVGVLLGVPAFTRPVALPVEERIPYRHEVVFSYTAPAIPQVYDADKVRPGEPVFHQLTGSMVVEASYRLESQAPVQNIQGLYRLVAQVRDGRGWQRTVELVPETAFDTSEVDVRSSLDLNTIQRFIDLLEERTGVTRSAYQVVVFLDLEVRAQVAGRALHDRWQPALHFGWDRWELYLTNPGANPMSGPQDPLRPVLDGQLTYQRLATNTLMVLGHPLPVATARGLAVALFLLGLGSGGALLWQMNRVLEEGDPLRQMRWLVGPRLMAARSLPPAEPAWIEVGETEALARLADQNQETVFYLEEGSWVHFWVALPSGVYHRLVPRQVVEVEARPAEERGLALWPWTARRQVKKGLVGVLEGWARAVGRLYGDEEHSQRVVDLAVRLARRLGVRGRALEHLYWGALVHDLGLVEVPVEVLRKPGALSPHERHLVREHPRRLREYLGAVPQLAAAVEIATHHHERWDGNGYPDGLQGEAIPLGSRILAVAEAYDALTHERPYRPAWSPEEALRYLEEQAEAAFDRRVVAALAEVLREEGVLPNGSQEEGETVASGPDGAGAEEPASSPPSARPSTEEEA